MEQRQAFNFHDLNLMMTLDVSLNFTGSEDLNVAYITNANGKQ